MCFLSIYLVIVFLFLLWPGLSTATQICDAETKTKLVWKDFLTKAHYSKGQEDK